MNWDTSYLSLPAALYRKLSPTPVSKPEVVALNAKLAQDLGLHLESLQSELGAQVLSGNTLIPGSDPIAQAYAGHQFGHFTQLGDGRAILLGEHISPAGGRFDIHLKGSGPTPFSRRGDGRAALGPMLREYLISEAMQGLGIPTTRSLAVTLTGEPVYRERILQGAILTRIASSHLRVGTFQHTLALGDPVALRALIFYALRRHYPQEASNLNLSNPSISDDSVGFEAALTLLKAVTQSQAKLVAQWLSVGFIHGVMNTDNMTISGETIDYGPCAFMDEFNFNRVFSSIDRNGRYAYMEQPKIALWNLMRLAESLIPVLREDQTSEITELQRVTESFSQEFNRQWLQQMGNKLGLTQCSVADLELIQELLSLMHTHQLDFHSTWLNLTDSLETQLIPPLLQPWANRWAARLQKESEPRSEIQNKMRQSNPRMIPRNHRVEEALEAAEEGNYKPFWRLVDAVQIPFQDRPEFRDLSLPPPPDQKPYQTYCGT